VLVWEDLILSNFPCGSKLRQDSKTDETDHPDLNGFKRIVFVPIVGVTFLFTPTI
jgi:hypothetical protein